MPTYRPRISETVEACQFRFDCMIPLENGEITTVNKGDFLVTNQSGQQWVARKSEFLEAYEPVLKPGRKAKGTATQVEETDAAN